MEVREGTARRWAALTLVTRAVLLRTVRMFGRTGQAEQTELPNLHPGEEFDGQCRNVGQLEGHMPREARIDEACGGVGEQSKTTE